MDDADSPNIFDQLEAAYGSRKHKVAAVRQVADKVKSSAQVATLVRPQVVRPKSGGLKPKRKRPFRLMGRFSQEEKQTVGIKARVAGLTVNEYIRVSTLGANYASKLDPAMQKFFNATHRELCKQGTHLNEIEARLKTNALAPEEADSELGIIARSLRAAHMGVLKAIAAASTKPYD